MITYSELVKEGIRKAYEEEAKNTIVTKHEDGVDTITKFYKKGKAIWCRMTTGCIETNSRVYRVNSDEPYIRDMGCIWYLGEEEKRIIASM